MCSFYLISRWINYDIPIFSFAFGPTSGSEISGDVIEVGEAVSSFRVGDRVFGLSPEGAFAEETVVADAVSVFNLYLPKMMYISFI